jgi:predicted DNA-binding transcriptional regulator AlpA
MRLEQGSTTGLGSEISKVNTGARFPSGGKVCASAGLESLASEKSCPLAVIFGKNSMSDNVVYLTSKQVCLRFGGISDMSLWRWLQNPELGFPPPMRIATRRYWRLADLEAWEQSRAAATSPTINN